MSFSTIAGGFLKLPRLFLKICRWVLVRMALNCLLSGSKQRLLANSNPIKEKKKKKKKEVFEGGSSSSGWERWRKILLIVWVLSTIVSSIWILSGLGNNGDSREKKLSDFWQTKAQILNHNSNANAYAFPSMLNKPGQKTPLACIENRRFQVSQSNDIACPLNILCSEVERIEKHNSCVTDKLDAKEQYCPVRFEHITNMFEPRSPYTKSDSSSAELTQATNFYLQNNRTNKENVSQTSKLKDSSEEHCEGVSICWLKIWLYTIVGMILSWKFTGYCERWLVHPEEELVKQQQQQQQTLLPLQQNQQLLLSEHFTQHSGLWRTKLLILFLVAGFIGSVWIFWYMNRNLVTTRRETLTNMCDERARMLQDQFNVSMNHVHALAILVSTFYHGKTPAVIDQKVFADYTEKTAFERPLTSGVAYALKVLHSEREEFEKIHGWKIKKMETEDESRAQDYTPEDLEPSPIQDEYAPVIFSQETVAHIVSIDMMSGKEDRENILRARSSGKGVLTSPFPLLKSNHLGVVLTFAVYNTNLPTDATIEERIAATKGYLGASYDIPSLVDKLLHQLASKQNIVVNVYDTTNSSEPINMYGPKVIDTGLLHRSSLDFGDPSRRHEMQCRFTHKPSVPWIAIMSAFGVIVITLLVSHIFYAALNRIAKVEGDFSEMMVLKIRAEAADVAKSQFLATVSHEIRTPMNGVLGMLQMLMDTELDGNQHDFAQTAYGSGKDLISLINEVLDQAKIESGRMELEAVNFDLRTSLDNVLSLFTEKCHSKGIELAVYVSSEVPEVLSGDPGRFRQIVTNLIGNSIKFTERGHIFVSVHLVDEVRNPLEVRDKVLKQQLLVKNGAAASCNTVSGFPVVDRWRTWENFKNLNSENGTEETNMIRLIVTVEDTGVGIPEEAQSRIFMPFMQADSSTSRNYGGTGIGLSISKCLVDIMGGEIGFASDTGIGSSFSFTSIFAKGKPDSPNTNQDSFALSINEFRGLRGLVVDGKSTRAEVTRYHLQRLGISADIVTSLKSACSYMSNPWDSSANTRLHIVLVEKECWNDGTALVSRHTLKELCQNGIQKPSKNCPKIFILTSSRTGKLNESKAFGCVDDIIVKPLRLNMMSTRFEQALGEGTNKHQVKRKPSNLQSLLSGKHILVVDDNIVNLRVAEGALKKCGASVTCVNSGKAAVEMLQPPHHFDACFMDLQMPEMDGFEATDQIRHFEAEFNERIKQGAVDMQMFGNVKHWHTPILAMTADVIQATHQKCASWGMDDYVSKPFEEQQLYSAVLRFFV